MAYAFKTLRPLFRERGKINAEVTGRLTEALGGIRVVKSYTAEKREEIVFTKGAHRLFRNVAQSMTGVSATTAGSTVIVGIIGILMIWLGGRAIIAGEMTLGDLIDVHLLHRSRRCAARVDRVDRHANHRGLCRPRSHPRDPRHDDRARRGSRNAAGPTDCAAMWRSTRCGSSTTPDNPCCAACRFMRAPGTTTALVGSSGSGKSTLISIVMAFNRPTQGRVLVDGTDLADVRLLDYRQQLASVLQENFLFDGTIAENVGYANPCATVDEIKEACRIAHCDEFISQFPEGYDTVVGERGIKLSGGQRQRVSIARAILADPRILILDEATSSLDSESEQMIQDGLRASAVRPHDVRHRASPVDDPQRRSDSGARGGRDRRARHPCRAARAERPLPAAVRQAVPVRDRSLHQPGRRLHAGAGEAEDASRSRVQRDLIRETPETFAADTWTTPDT